MDSWFAQALGCSRVNYIYVHTLRNINMCVFNTGTTCYIVLIFSNEKSVVIFVINKSKRIEE